MSTTEGTSTEGGPVTQASQGAPWAAPAQPKAAAPQPQGVQMADLVTDEKVMEYQYGQHLITLTFRPGAVTHARMQEVRAAVEADPLGTGDGAMLAILSDVLVGWDLLDGAEMYPTTYEGLSTLPLKFCMGLLNAMQEVMSTGEAPAP